MATYSLCRAKPQVRLLAPHPLLFILLALVLCCGRGSAADVGDIAHYSAAPGTLVAAAVSSESLARVVGGDIFGVYWSTFGGNGQITAIDGVSMRDRADGVQELATATYSTFKGVEKAIADSAATDPLVLQWLETIYDQLYTSSRSGDEVTKTSVSDLVSSALGIMSSVPGYSWFNGSSGQWAPTSNIAGALAHLNSSLFNAVVVTNWLDIYGATSGGQISLARGMGQGFLGLAHLLFGDAAHNIYGLSYTGDDKEAQRGGWSLADISANGFRGLATLIGGQDSGDGRGAVWYWTDPTDPTAPQRTYEVSSLFDMFWLLGQFQNSLAKLEYVYASQEDIEFKEQEKPNMDAVKDNFFGDGEAAVNPDQIKEVAGVSSGLTSAFKSPVSISGFLAALSDSGNYLFFSQETADNLDQVAAPAPAAASDPSDPYPGYVLGEDGLYYPEHSFDLFSYLEGLS